MCISAHYELLSKVLMEQKGRTHQKGQQGFNLALPENHVAYLQIHFMSALPHTSDSTIMGWVPWSVPLLTLLFVPIFNHIRMYVLTYSTLQDLLLHITHSLSALACATSTSNSLSTHLLHLHKTQHMGNWKMLSLYTIYISTHSNYVYTNSRH